MIYTCLAGIKIVDSQTGELARLLGKAESSERFLDFALLTAAPLIYTRHIALSGNALGGGEQPDPTIFASSFQKNRFFLFTQREPEDK